MKKTALIAAALTMVLTLAACGNRDNDSNNQPNNQTGSNGTTQAGGTQGDNSTTPNDQNGSGLTGGGSVNNGSTTNGGASTGSGSITGGGTTTGSGSITGGGTTTGNDSMTGGGTTNGTTGGSSTAGSSTNGRSVGNDLRRAADDVGDAVTGMVEGGRDALTHTASTTSFQRMLDNARVHDTDGILTDGENSRW